MPRHKEQNHQADAGESKSFLFRHPWSRSAVAAIILLAALGVSYGFSPLLGGHLPFLFFVVASLITAWICGLGPGVAVLGIGFVIVELLFVFPSHGHWLNNPVDLAMMLLNACAAGVGLAAIHTLHRARQDERKLHSLTRQLEREVAERRRAEAALASSKEDLDFAMESAGMWTWNLDLQECAFEWSRHYEFILGPRQGALPGTCEEFMRYVYPEDRALLKATLARCIEQRTDFEQEYRVIWTDGSQHWILAKGRILRDDKDAARRVCGIMMEITERKRAEQALRRSEAELANYAHDLERRVAERTAKSEETVRSLEGVLYHVAHDLRAPLRTMAGFTQMLTESIGSRVDEEGRDAANRITIAARYMDRLILDLLAYGRMGHVPISLERVGLDEQINEVLREMAGEIEARRAMVEVARPLPMVRADTAILKLAALNILKNALTFVAPGVAPRVHIRPEMRGTMARLWFQDNGIGIEPEYQERIFRVFERLHRAEEYTGTGIGLAIVFKGMERMGGAVGVQSKPGKGSRFWLELPLAGDET